MFETLVETRREKAAAHTVAALPVALGTQVVVGCALLLYSLFAAQTIQPPPLMAGWFFETQQVIVPLAKSPGTQNRHEATKRIPGGIIAPPAPPIGIPPVTDPQVGGPEGPPNGDPGGVDGGMPPGPGYKPPEAPITTPVNGPLPPERVRVPHLVRNVAPQYPPAAIAMHLTGRVVVQLVVNEAGRVVDAQVLSSTNVIFNEAALRAVRQWEFTRPLDAQSQQAVSCYLPVVVNFNLN
jgi:protein TonB